MLRHTFFFCSLPVVGIYIYLEDIFVRGRCFSECLTVFDSQGKFVHLNNTQQKNKIHHGAHNHFMGIQMADFTVMLKNKCAFRENL